MKKIKILIPITITFLILSTSVVQGDYLVTVGQTFTYNVNRSFWRVKVGSDIGSALKYNIGLTSSDEGSSFVINVTDVIPATSVDYNIEVGGATYPSSNDFITFAFMIQDLFYMNTLGVVFSGAWQQLTVDLGPGLHGEFFFNIGSEVLNYFRDHSNTTYLTNTYTFTAYDFSQIKGNFDESSDVVIFDWIIEGSINNVYTAYPFEVEGYELFKIAFNNNTGVLQGYRIELDYSGTSEGRDFEVHLEQEVTLDGYTLPAFYYDKPAGLPGFEWYLSFAAFSTIIIAIIITRRRK